MPTNEDVLAHAERMLAYHMTRHSVALLDANAGRSVKKNKATMRDAELAQAVCRAAIRQLSGGTA